MKHYYISLLLAGLIGCIPINQNNANHYVNIISCKNTVDESTYDQLLELLPYLPMGIYERTDEVSRLESFAKHLANQGNGRAMQVYGGIKLYFAIIGSVHPNEEKSELVNLPPAAKKDMIEAMTYIHLSAMTENTNKDVSWEHIKEFEAYVKHGGLPAKWLDEAKINVERWKRRCGVE